MNSPTESGSQACSITTNKTAPATVATHQQTAVKEIARLHNEIIDSARTTLDKAIRIGELLTGVRAGLKHGEWLPWIQKYIPFSERTTQNYIRCFNEKDRLKSANVADLSGAYLLLSKSKIEPTTMSPASEVWLDTPLTLEDFQPVPADEPFDDFDIIESVCIMRCFCLGPVFKNYQPIPVTRRELFELRSRLDARREADARRKI